MAQLASDSLARSETLIEPTETEYDRFCQTVMQTARGRWFLAEYAHRHRNASTEAALDALRRIEDNLRHAAPSAAIEQMREELRSVAATIHGARLDIGAADSEFSRGAKVMALLVLLEQRIGGIIEQHNAEKTQALSPPLPQEDKADARTRLTVVVAHSPPPGHPIRARVEPPAVELVPQPAVGPSQDAEAIAVSPTPPVELAVPVSEAVLSEAILPEPGIDRHPDDMFVPYEFDPLERPLPVREPQASVNVPPPQGHYDPMTPVMALTVDERIALVS
jgi:hypothetical protein